MLIHMQPMHQAMHVDQHRSLDVFECVGGARTAPTAQGREADSLLL